jgi:alpha-ketoglutarate-dependent taurine dioxygenase
METITEIQVDDIKRLSDTQVKQIAVLAAHRVNVLIKGQELTKADYARMMQCFGVNPKRDVWFEDKDHHEVMYVTNKLMCGDEGNKPGVFSRGELNWHQNGTLTLDPEDCVVLYCEEPTKNPCNTHFTNGVAAYNSLPQDVKDKIENTELILTADTRSFHKLKNPHFVKRSIKPRILDNERVWTEVPMEEIAELWKIQDRTRSAGSAIEREMMEKVEKYSEPGARWNMIYKRLVHRHRLTGIKGLYFPFSNVIGFHDIPEDEWQDLFNFLKDHFLKTSAEVEWEHGDIVLFDNTQGLHKRSVFPKDENGNDQSRELWRGAFWYHDIK